MRELRPVCRAVMSEIFYPYHDAQSSIHGNVRPFVYHPDFAERVFWYRDETYNPNDCYDEARKRGIW